MKKKNAGRLMIPSTSDATQKPLFAPMASAVVPSIVNGMPQLLQLLEVMELFAEQRGQMMNCLPSALRVIFGARRPRPRRRVRDADPA